MEANDNSGSSNTVLSIGVHTDESQSLETLEECSSSSDHSEGEIGRDQDQLLPPPTCWFDEQQQQQTNNSSLLSSSSSSPLLLPSSLEFVDNNNTNSRKEESSSIAAEDAATTTATNVDENVREESSSSSLLLLDKKKKNVTNSATVVTAVSVVGAPLKAPSWKELSSQVLPRAAQELLSSSLRRVWHTARISYYSRGRWHRRYSDMGNNACGYFRTTTPTPTTSTSSSTSSMVVAGQLLLGETSNAETADVVHLPPFSSLNWVDRQLVKEWRTVCWGSSQETEEEKEQQQQQHGPDDDDGNEIENEEDEDDMFFSKARTLIPQPRCRPTWAKSDNCFACHKPFGPTLLRHHCRLCGQSFCHGHSSYSHKLPHLGYDPDVPERVCDDCKRRLVEHNLAERVAWRLARCRDYLDSDLTPYFETGVDTYEDAALRLTRAAIVMARNIPLGAQAHVAVETVEVLRKHGLKGIYGLILRKEFLAAADLLCRVLGINKTAWPLSVHELSAAIFYALAQHRAMRGLNPEREHLIHTFRREANDDDQTTVGEKNVGRDSLWTQQSPPRERLSLIHEESAHSAASCTVVVEKEETEVETSTQDAPFAKHESTVSDNSVIDDTDTYNPLEHNVPDLLTMENDGGRTQKSLQVDDEELPFTPVCDPVPDPVLASLLFYAPIALNFIYAEREVDMQLLAAQQGWRLLYAHLEQDCHSEGFFSDRPASALFLHKEQKIACLAVRGTATVNDVVTDIRQVPVPFPETETDVATAGGNARFDDDWTPVFQGQGLAACGMARAAVNLYREHIDALVLLSEKGYRIRITGHSLGASVATLLGALVLRHFEQSSADRSTSVLRMSPSTPEHSDLLRVYGYGSPSCVDAELSDYVKSFVTTVVLHDDVVPRLTPTSIRGLLKHLLHIRETWVKMHLGEDLRAISDRARTAWAPRWRGSFTIGDSSKVKRYCRKQIQYGKKKLMSVKGSVVSKLVEEETQERSQETSVSADGADSTLDVGNEVDVSDESFSVQPRDSDKSTDIANLKEEHFADPPSKDPAASRDASSDVGSADSPGPQSDDSSNDEAPGEVETETVHIVDFIGGIDKRKGGIILDGEEFFDTQDTLIESEDESSTDDSLCMLGPIEVPSERGELADEESLIPEEESDADGAEAINAGGTVAAEEDSWVPYDEHEEAVRNPSDLVSLDSGRESLEEEGVPSAVILEETPLPRMFLPGKIVHIYTHRGGYKAAFVPRAFRELRRISLAGNMLSDHTTQAYYEALLEVQSVRNAPEGLPKWTAFDEDHTCSCCASRFTWASTSDSKAQEARDKHNCRSCGTLVCDPCAKRRMPLPSIGINVAVRVCDRCYNDQSGALTGRAGSSLASSFLEDSHYKNEQDQVAALPSTYSGDGAKEQPERQRDRRSLVVDELASRIHSTVSCT